MWKFCRLLGSLLRWWEVVSKCFLYLNNWKVSTYSKVNAGPFCFQTKNIGCTHTKSMPEIDYSSRMQCRGWTMGRWGANTLSCCDKLLTTARRDWQPCISLSVPPRRTFARLSSNNFSWPSHYIKSALFFLTAHCFIWVTRFMLG